MSAWMTRRSKTPRLSDQVDMLRHVSKLVLRGRRNTLATFSEDGLYFSWQAQHFGRVHLHFSWQAQHFRRVVCHDDLLY